MVIICALGFGFIGFCLGSNRGLWGELCLSSILGLFGGIFGYGYGLAMVYSCTAIASWKLKKSHAKNQ